MDPIVCDRCAVKPCSTHKPKRKKCEVDGCDTQTTRGRCNVHSGLRHAQQKKYYQKTHVSVCATRKCAMWDCEKMTRVDDLCIIHRKKV